MAMDIVKLYISLVSEFFTLSYGNFPQNSHSLSIAHYLLKILGDIQETISELNGMEISQDNSLKGLLDSVRCRFIDVLVNSWLRGTHYYSVIVASFIHIPRCPNLLFDGGLVIELSRTLHHPSPCSNGDFPETARYCSI